MNFVVILYICVMSKLHVNLSFYVIGGRRRSSDVVTTGRMVHPWSLGVGASESWSPAVNET